MLQKWAFFIKFHVQGFTFTAEHVNTQKEKTNLKIICNTLPVLRAEACQNCIFLRQMVAMPANAANDQSFSIIHLCCFPNE